MTDLQHKPKGWNEPLNCMTDEEWKEYFHLRQVLDVEMSEDEQRDLLDKIDLALVNEGASIYFNGALFENNSIDSVNGKITLKLENKDSYKFKFNKKYKDVFIEDKKVSKLSYGYGKNIITIKKNSGNVDINFVGDVSV